MRLPVMRWIVGVMLGMVFSACGPIVPAETPVQLHYTPTAFITIDEAHYQAVRFTTRYPAGWRVVKLNTEGTPDHVIFVAPDESILISISHQPPQLAESARTVTEQTTITADDATLYLYGEAEPDAATTLSARLEAIRAGLIIHDAN